MTELSVLIPARNEMFLKHTIDDVLAHIEGDTEIICVLDGQWPVEPIPDHKRVTLVHHSQSIGQRAATNEAAKLSSARYVMKCDAHCSFGPGFDRIMMEDMEPHYTMVPMMYNLHVFDWVCQECKHRKYQGPTPEACGECGGKMERDIQWKAKPSPETTAMRFDRDLKFKYWSGYKKRQEGDLVDTMSILGACWMLERERYHELDICDERHGGWGQQGTEVACKTWLSGGRLVVNKRTWFAHMFRTQGGDFGFPYPISGNDTKRARKYSQKLWNLDKPDELPDWDKAKYPLAWLIDRFAPVPDWEEPVTKAILYYTCNEHDEQIEAAARRQLLAGRNGYELGVVSRKPVNGFGDWNIVVDRKRGPETMHRQILAGLERIEADVVFMAESDVLYHPSHFELTPSKDDTFYYNTNVWRVRHDDGHAVWTDDLHQVSGLCARRELLLDFYQKRVEQIERDGFNRHFEPGPKQSVGSRNVEGWESEYPNLDIRHGKTLTRSKWSPAEFRNARYARGWKETDDVPGWGQTGGRMKELLDGLP